MLVLLSLGGKHYSFFLFCHWAQFQMQQCLLLGIFWFGQIHVDSDAAVVKLQQFRLSE